MPLQQCLDKNSLKDLMVEKLILTEASGLVPGLYDDELAEVQASIAILASGLNAY